MASDHLVLKMKPSEGVTFLELEKLNNFFHLSLSKPITSIFFNFVDKLRAEMQHNY